MDNRERLEDLNRDHHRRMNELSHRFHDTEYGRKLDGLNLLSREAIVAAMRGCHDRAKMGNNGIVLELGCGYGQDYQYLLPTLGTTHYRAVEVVKECAVARTDIECHNLAVHELPQGWNGKIKWVYSRHVMEHVIDIDASLSAIKRVLAPNGVVGAVTPHVFPDNEPAHVTVQTLSEWMEHYRRNGLRPVYAVLHDYACLEAHVVCMHEEFPFDESL